MSTAAELVDVDVTEATASATTSKAPPKFLHPNFDGVPTELKQIKNWVMWRYLPPKRKGGQWRKVPFQPNGKTANTTRRSTWRRFDECVAAYTQGGFDGVGFVFDGEPDEYGLVYAGVDFDSGALKPDCPFRVEEWVDRFGSYVEASVSGKGLHVILKATPLASGIAHAGVELYTSGRYFTMTGRTVGVPKSVIVASAAFAALAKELQANSGASMRNGSAHEPMPTSNVVPFKLPDWAMNGRPAAAFAPLLLELRAEGAEPNIQKIRSAVDAIPPSLMASEPQWMRIARALAHQAAVSPDLAELLWDLLDTASRRAPGYDQDDNRSRWERYVSEAFNTENPITIATVFDLAYKHGWDGWSCPLLAKGKSPLNIRPDVSTGANPAAGDAPQVDPSCVHSDAEFVGKTSPITVLMALHAKGAGLKRLFDTMNQTYAVVKCGTQILVATIDDDICLMKVEDFHKMLANIVVVRNNEEIAVSRLWFKSKDRRQYLGAGVVFQPGRPPEIKGDMLNLWRGFGIKPIPGNWSLLRDHIFKEVCSGRQEYFDYLIRWMAYAVQHPDRPMGVAVAFLGAQGAGKGIVARTFGKFFGKHFAHIANGDQLTGRFNASIGMSCVVFLDEALWAGDKKGEGVLKALITEPSLQLEAKFRDPIRVENRLRIIVASNNDWAIPAGIGDRRWFVLNVADTYSGIAHQKYWDAVYNQIDCGGAAAMLHDMLSLDVSSFNVRAVPHTAAKALQQVHSLQGAMAWLHDILQEGSISGEQWQDAGLTTETDRAYMCYVEFSKRQRAWKPEIKAVWSKNIQAALGAHVALTRPTKGNTRVRSFQFAPLADCRHKFASHLSAPDLEWEDGSQPNQSEEAPEDTWDYDDARLDLPADEWEPDLDPEPDYETEGDAD